MDKYERAAADWAASLLLTFDLTAPTLVPNVPMNAYQRDAWTRAIMRALHGKRGRAEIVAGLAGLWSDPGIVEREWRQLFPEDAEQARKMAAAETKTTPRKRKAVAPAPTVRGLGVIEMTGFYRIPMFPDYGINDYGVVVRLTDGRGMAKRGRAAKPKYWQGKQWYRLGRNGGTFNCLADYLLQNARTSRKFAVTDKGTMAPVRRNKGPINVV